ncbi:MAG: MMPL family transporter [Actinomycetaceae bacterium]|nr:MMPL family transporter [Actinomycetaceae bacterium]
MFRLVGKGVARRPLAVVVAWSAIIIVSALWSLTGFGAGGLFSRLDNSMPSNPGSESLDGQSIIDRYTHDSYPVVGYVSHIDVEKNADVLKDQVIDLHRDLLDIKGVHTVVDSFALFDPGTEIGKKADKAVNKQIDDTIKEQTQKAEQELRHGLAAQGLLEYMIEPAVEQQMPAIRSQIESEVRQGIKKTLNEQPVWERIKEADTKEFLGKDRQSFLINVGIDTTTSRGDNVRTDTEAVLSGFQKKLRDAGFHKATVEITNKERVSQEIQQQTRKDLYTGEGISLPISLVIMAVVFGGLLAGIIPLSAAAVAIAVSLLVMFFLTFYFEQPAFVINIISVLGLGLSIDYGLLIVSRYREELRNILDSSTASDVAPSQAVTSDQAIQAVFDGQCYQAFSQVKAYGDTFHIYQRHIAAAAKTISTAGRTVFFSGITVALSISAIQVFNPPQFQSIAAGGVTVVLVAVISAITLVPAILLLMGTALEKPSILRKIPGFPFLFKTFDTRPRPGSALERMCHRVTYKPWPYFIAAVVILVVLASPIIHIEIRTSETEAMPKTMKQIELLDRLDTSVPAAEHTQIAIVAKAGTKDLDNWIKQREKSIDNIEKIVPSYELGDGYALSDIRVKGADPGSKIAENVMLEFRDRRGNNDPGFQTWITGNTANQHDFQEAVYERAWLMGGIIFLSTFIMMFLMTGSVVIPLKAIVTNSLSLMASLGVGIWIFQFGHCEDFLGFTSLGGLETYVIVVALCFGFGLSMDYEMFLMARMKEEYDHHQEHRRSIQDGLHESAGVITSAAVILLVVFLGFTAGEMLFIKQVGLILAVAVFIDATLVRLFLVPSTMSLLGKFCWWAPRFMKKISQALPLHH